jgi:16S rRNA (cytidine1402-2'-O)-methyltransferase
VPLVLLGAPLGNIADASLRLGDTLGSADVIAAEDTRRLMRLARELGVTLTGRVVSYFAGNEDRRIPDLLEALRSGATVALITDGGMPSVSDPGFALVRAAVAAGIAVTAVPGPSAVTTAVALSGLPADRFCFEGFLPRRAGQRRARLAELATERRTMVFFEAPHRVAETLADLAQVFGAERPAALCRELTKTYEEVRRGSLAELAEGAAGHETRGEITLVVAGAPATQVSTAAPDLATAVAELEADGTPRKAAISAVAVARGVPKRDVYAAVVGTRASRDGLPGGGE